MKVTILLLLLCTFSVFGIRLTSKLVNYCNTHGNKPNGKDYHKCVECTNFRGGLMLKYDCVYDMKTGDCRKKNTARRTWVQSADGCQAAFIRATPYKAITNKRIAFEMEFPNQLAHLKASKVEKVSCREKAFGLEIADQDVLWEVSVDNAFNNFRFQPHIDIFKTQLNMPTLLKSPGFKGGYSGILEMKTNGITELTTEKIALSKVQLYTFLDRFKLGCLSETETGTIPDPKFNVKYTQTRGKQDLLISYCLKSDPTDCWVFVVMCASYNRINEVQVTLDVPLHKLVVSEDNVSPFIYQAFVKGLALYNGPYQAWLENEDVRTYITSFTTQKARDQFKAILMLSSFWLKRAFGQKQSINPLPKINLCSLTKIFYMMNPEAPRTIGESSVGAKLASLLAGQTLKNSKGYLKYIFGDYNTLTTKGKKFCVQKAVYNGHAGAFATKIDFATKSIEVALEARKAQELPLGRWFSDERADMEGEVGKMIQDYQ